MLACGAAGGKKGRGLLSPSRDFGVLGAGVSEFLLQTERRSESAENETEQVANEVGLCRHTLLPMYVPNNYLGNVFVAIPSQPLSKRCVRYFV